MKNIGTLGEELVGRWLELQNYSLLQQNWRCRWGEIDIIAQDRSKAMPSTGFAIAFVEVKTRSKNNWDEGGLLAVNAIKQEKIIKTASLFLAKHPQFAELPCRFDVALVSYKNRALVQQKTIIDPQKITQITIGQPVVIKQHIITIENYLQSVELA